MFTATNAYDTELFASAMLASGAVALSDPRGFMPRLVVPALGPAIEAQPRPVMEETAESHLRRLQAGKPASFPVRLHGPGDFGKEEGRGIDLIPARFLGKRFLAWWMSAVERPETINSSKNEVTPAIGARLFLAGVPARDVARLPWTGGEVQITSVRTFRALRCIGKKLGRRASRISRSGLTMSAPSAIAYIAGRDLVRLSRMSADFLRWLCAIDAQINLIKEGPYGPTYSNRVDWKAVQALHVEYRGLDLESLQEAKIPMRLWRKDTDVSEIAARAACGGAMFLAGIYCAQGCLEISRFETPIEAALAYPHYAEKIAVWLGCYPEDMWGTWVELQAMIYARTDI